MYSKIDVVYLHKTSMLYGHKRGTKPDFEVLFEQVITSLFFFMVTCCLEIILFRFRFHRVIKL